MDLLRVDHFRRRKVARIFDNRLTLVKELGTRLIGNFKMRMGEYSCSCGNTFEARISAVNAGNTKSCGCIKREASETRNAAAGAVYNRLTLIKRVGTEKSGDYGLYQCTCGAEKRIRMYSVETGAIKSCGCLKTELFIARSTKHGLKGHELYGVWKSMRTRCNNPNADSYLNYGGRGIKICKRWDDFKSFLGDMGPRPSPRYQIDRKDNNGDYGPGNCRWVVRAINNKNTRRSKRWVVRGITYFSSSDAAKLLGVSRTAIYEWCNGRAASCGRRAVIPKSGCRSYLAYENNW